MRGPAVIFALALGGCRALIGIDDPVVAADAASDTAVDQPADAGRCFGVAPFELCITVPGRTTFDIVGSTAVTVDTDTTCDEVVRGWCVIVASTISISAQLRVTGTRPFALLALDTMQVNGTISGDANGAVAGPGGDPANCTTGTAAQSGDLGGGGGAGGSFATIGGLGGFGNVNHNAGASAGAVVTTIDTLRGGCAGSAGADGGGSANPPGAGGGGIYLLAGTKLAIGGKVDVGGGGGGRGNLPKAGGSGGGSGGMIVLWSPMVTGTPTLVANGGGGGGGADQGAPGDPGSETSSVSSAAGGLGGTPGAGRGGRGSSGTGPGLPGTDDQTQAGGGGGGGGGGVIRVLGGNQLTSPIASPPPS